MKSILIFSFLLFSLSKCVEQPLKDESYDEETYFTTWATAILSTEQPKLSLSNNSIRQIVHVSASGENIRLRLSNKLGNSDLVIKEVSIADSISQGTGEINTNTSTLLTFKGEKGIIIPAGEEMYSDRISYSLKSLSEIAISIYFGETPQRLSGHPGSRTFSFIEEGNKINNQEFSKEYKIDHWYFISALEVSSYPRKKTIVCFGDSITDGQGSATDKQNRWPDLLATKLHLNLKTSEIAVVNKGINGNKITTQGIERYTYDALDIKGVTYIMLLYGVNDINLLNATASEVISAYKQVIKEAHKKNIFIFAGTILPYRNFKRWTEERESYRQEVNNWIRNTKPSEGGFDAVFDYDKFMKDPNDETKLYSYYDSGDGLHPSPEGYQRIAQAIDNLDLFTKDPHFEEDKEDDNGEDKGEGEMKIIDKIGIKFKLDFTINKDEEISVNIKGKCEGSTGFRLLTSNDEGAKTSDYYYSGKIGEGNFEYVIKLKANDISNYIEIRRPLSTINIDNIIFNSIEISVGENHKVFKSIEEGILL